MGRARGARPKSQILLFRIQEPLAAAGPSEQRVRADAITAAATPLLPALERTMLLLHRRHLEHYIIELLNLSPSSGSFTRFR